MARVRVIRGSSNRDLTVFINREQSGTLAHRDELEISNFLSEARKIFIQ